MSHKPFQPRGFSISQLSVNQQNQNQQQPSTRDLFLYALFARIASADDTNTEFKTEYNLETNTIELQIPNNILSFINEIHIGPNAQRFVNWMMSTRSKSATIIEPDQVQVIQETVPLFPVEEDEFPNGIIINKIYLKASETSTMSIEIQKWLSPTDSAPSTIGTINLISETETSIDIDEIIDYSNIIMIKLDSADVQYINVTIMFRVN